MADFICFTFKPIVFDVLKKLPKLVGGIKHGGFKIMKYLKVE